MIAAMPEVIGSGFRRDFLSNPWRPVSLFVRYAQPDVGDLVVRYLRLGRSVRIPQMQDCAKERFYVPPPKFSALAIASPLALLRSRFCIFQTPLSLRQIPNSVQSNSRSSSPCVLYLRHANINCRLPVLDFSMIGKNCQYCGNKSNDFSFRIFQFAFCNTF